MLRPAPGRRRRHQPQAELLRPTGGCPIYSNRVAMGLPNIYVPDGLLPYPTCDLPPPMYPHPELGCGC